MRARCEPWGAVTMVDDLDNDDAPDGAAPGDDADAFEAARDRLAQAAREGADPETPNGKRERTERERTSQRWRSRNLRRRRAGRPELTDAENRALDLEAGVGGEPEAAAPGAPASGPAPGPARSGGRPMRATRAELEAEVARLRAKVDNEERAAVATAIGETARVVWDVVRRFTPSEDRELSDAEVSALGDVWAPVLGPRMQQMAEATPMVIAIGVTYRVLAPRVAAAVLDPAKEIPAAVAVTRDAPAAPAREFPAAPGDVAPRATEAVQRSRMDGEVPPGEDPARYGYTPVEGGS